MTGMATIIRSNEELFEQYHRLGAGDVVVGRIRLRSGEEHLLLDLVSRGVRLIPSALSQLCSRSKVFQARLLARYMVPGTTAVYDRHDLLSLVTDYGQAGTGAVVCKLDQANGGQGILYFRSVEDLYNQAVLATLPYPFVVQPFVAGARDVRAVLLGDRLDAYERCNQGNFRQNLHCGGTSSPYSLSPEQLAFCREVMARADFPYGHLDLLISPDDDWYLSEINLRGGLRGAAISQQDYLAATEMIHGQELTRLLDDSE